MRRDTDPKLDTRSVWTSVQRRTSPSGIPVPIDEEASGARYRPIGDTSDRLQAVSETAAEASAKAEALDREFQPWRAGIRAAKRWALGALSAAAGAVIAVVATLRSAAHDAGAAEERAKALEVEVRRLGTEVLYLRARLDGTPLPWYQPPRAADAKGPTP